MQNKAQIKNYWKRGITYTETIVYVAIFAVTFLVIAQFSLFANERSNQAIYTGILDNSMIYISSHLKKSFEDTITISSANSTFDNDSGKLYLINRSNGFYDYELVNGRIEYSDIEDVDLFLSSRQITVNTFRINRILDNNNQLGGVEIILEIESNTTPSYTKSSTLSFVVP